MQSDTIQFAATFGVPPALMFMLGVVFVVSGMYLRWRLSYLWMQAEERAKDGWLSEQQARRRIAVMRFGGPAMTLLGLATFAVLFWG